MKKIASFTGEYRFLSNFYPAEVLAKWNDDALMVPTVEHAFQAAKALNLKDFVAVCAAKTPGMAKKMGRKVVLRSAWDAVKLDVMMDLLRQKFSDKVLKAMLLDTRDAELVEGNTWGDTFWGVSKGEGQNHLGKLLMKLRQELAKGAPELTKEGK